MFPHDPVPLRCAEWVSVYPNALAPSGQGPRDLRFDGIRKRSGRGRAASLVTCQASASPVKFDCMCGLCQQLGLCCVDPMTGKCWTKMLKSPECKQVWVLLCDVTRFDSSSSNAGCRTRSCVLWQWLCQAAQVRGTRRMGMEEFPGLPQRVKAKK